MTETVPDTAPPPAYDSRADTLLHSLRVGQLMAETIGELAARSVRHDLSKTEPPEREAFDRMTPRLRRLIYGTPEYQESLAELGPALKHHYAHNAHHPEHGEPNFEWLPVVGYDGYYEVSNLGDVRSLTRVVVRSGCRGDLRVAGQAIRAQVTAKGYLRIQLSKGGSVRNHMVHRLVAEAFLPNPDSKPEVNHRNGNKADNRIGNLEWATTSENQVHAYDNGLKEAAVRYVVHCPELDLTTFGTLKMEQAVRARGYPNVSAAGIWSAMDRAGKHLGLTFEGTRVEEYHRSRVNGMTLEDLVEMLADWKAGGERMADGGDLLRSIRHGMDRFGIDRQLAQILLNTSCRRGWLPPDAAGQLVEDSTAGERS